MAHLGDITGINEAEFRRLRDIQLEQGSNREAEELLELRRSIGAPDDVEAAEQTDFTQRGAEIVETGVEAGREQRRRAGRARGRTATILTRDDQSLSVQGSILGV